MCREVTHDADVAIRIADHSDLEPFTLLIEIQVAGVR